MTITKAKAPLQRRLSQCIAIIVLLYTAGCTTVTSEDISNGVNGASGKTECDGVDYIRTDCAGAAKRNSESAAYDKCVADHAGDAWSLAHYCGEPPAPPVTQEMQMLNMPQEGVPNTIAPTPVPTPP